MAKDLEKCKLLENAFDLKTANFESLIAINNKLFIRLETDQKQREQLEKQVENLNKQKLKFTKQKKRSWAVPVMAVITGLVIGTNL